MEVWVALNHSMYHAKHRAAAYGLRSSSELICVALPVGRRGTPTDVASSPPRPPSSRRISWEACSAEQERAVGGMWYTQALGGHASHAEGRRATREQLCCLALVLPVSDRAQ